MRFSGRPWLFPVIAVWCAAALLIGCSGDDGTVSVGDGDDPSGASAAEVAYCDTAEQVIADGGELDLRTGGPETLASIELLAGEAPAELAEDYDTFVTGIRGVAQLDPDDPAALSSILDLMLDPDIASAAGAIEQYTTSTCGVTLWATTGSDLESSGSDEVGLEIDEVNEAMVTLGADGATWVRKLSLDGDLGWQRRAGRHEWRRSDRCRGAGRLCRVARSAVGS